MALQAPVYAGNITNLGDARYFAGMGVQWLGFQIDPNKKSYLSPQKFKEIAGWVTGPELVLEPDPVCSAEDLDSIKNEYGIDLFTQLPESGYGGPKGWYLDKPTDGSSIQLPSFLIMDPGPSQTEEVFSDLIEKHIQSIPIFIRVKSVLKAEQFMERFSGIGFYVSGSPELKPGIADYDDRELLEYLDRD